MARNEDSPIDEFMPFQGKKFFGSPWVYQMKAEQIGWYVTLLWRSWERGGYISATEPMWVLAGATTEALWEKHGAIVRQRFVKTEDGTRFFQPDLVALYEKKLERHNKAVNSGKRRWRVEQSSRIPRDSLSIASESDSIDLRKEKTVVGFELENFDPDEHFRHLQLTYKNAERGQAAEVAFMEAIESLVSGQKLTRTEASGYIIRAAEKLCAETERKFIPGMTKWLRTTDFTSDKWKPVPKGPSLVDEIRKERAEL